MMHSGNLKLLGMNVMALEDTPKLLLVMTKLM
jgi:hypothetical protein